MTYDRETAELLIPTIWDQDSIWGIQREHMPPPDMPKAKSNPAHGNTLSAYLTDIAVAWKKAPLSDNERRAVLMRFGLDLKHVDIASHEGCSRQNISHRLFTAVGKITAQLNGDTFKEDEEASDRHPVGSEWSDRVRAHLLAQEG